MKKRTFLATLLLFVAGLQTAWTQKMIVTFKNGQSAIEHDVSDIDEVSFSEEAATYFHYDEGVDLGLPSGTIWATKNLGATKSIDPGYYFAWGETTPKKDGTWDTYQLCKDGNKYWLTKYVSDPSYSYTGDIDLMSELVAADDAATAMWGTGWQMPSVEQCDELCNNAYTTQSMTWYHGYYGMLITSKSNGNSIFLPDAGRYYGNTRGISGCWYWSRSRESYDDEWAWTMINDRGSGTTVEMDRCFAQSIRPVRVQHDYVDLGLPSGTLWATCNVGASKPEEYGDYFAWGETWPKKEYSWDTYKWMNEGQSSFEQISKYTIKDRITQGCWYDGSENFIGDEKTVLDSKDDAATANWGSDWQMPSQSQMTELTNDSYTTKTFTTQNGVNGIKITSKNNGNSIFLPAAGYYDNYFYDGSFKSEVNVSVGCYYWSLSHTYTSYDLNNTTPMACLLSWKSGNYSIAGMLRYLGMTIRPVLKE